MLGDTLIPRPMEAIEMVPNEDRGVGSPMNQSFNNENYQQPAAVPDDEALMIMPTKPVVSTQMVELRANILFIDFEGRSDGESMKKIVQQIKPTKLVLVHGNEESTKLMSEFCESTMAPRTSVHAPRPLERLDLSSDRHMYQVRLTDQLASGLKFFKAGDFEVAWVDGMISSNRSGDQLAPNMDSAPGSRAAPMEAVTLHEATPLLDELPQDEVPYHDSLFVSEPRLVDLKQVLLRQNIKAEFTGGVLVCEDKVAVKRVLEI